MFVKAGAVIPYRRQDSCYKINLRGQGIEYIYTSLLCLIMDTKRHVTTTTTTTTTTTANQNRKIKIIILRQIKTIIIIV